MVLPSVPPSLLPSVLPSRTPGARPPHAACLRDCRAPCRHRPVPPQGRHLVVAAARLPASVRLDAGADGRHGDIRGVRRAVDPAGDPGDHRRPAGRRRPRSHLAAGPADARARRARGGAGPDPALGAGPGRARRGDRDPPRPLRRPRRAADAVPRALAERPAAVPHHDRPVHDPAVLRLRDAVPRHQRAADGRHGRPAAAPVLAARPGGRRRRGPGGLAVPVVRAALRRGVPPGAGPAGRRRQPGRGGGGRLPGDPVLRQTAADVRQVQRRRDQALRLLGRQGPPRRAVLDLPRGDPQHRAGPGAAARARSRSGRTS